MTYRDAYAGTDVPPYVKDGGIVFDEDWVEIQPVEVATGVVRELEVYPSKSKTVQSDADAADINKIMKRMEQMGVVPALASAGFYADVSEVTTYRGALDELRRATEYFSQLTAEQRFAFRNDVANFVDELHDPTKLDRLVALKIVEPPEGYVPPVAGGAGAPPKEAAPGSVDVK